MRKVPGDATEQYHDAKLGDTEVDMVFQMFKKVAVVGSRELSWICTLQ